MNGTTLSVTNARKHYHAASRAFIVRDYASAASSLHSASTTLPESPAGRWLDSLTHGEPIALVDDLKRRLDIFQITLLATVHASATPRAPTPNLTRLLDLSPSQLVASLWNSLVNPEATDSNRDIFPTSSAALVHPSIPTALCLAALKLDQPSSARAVAEAWLGSTSEPLEKIAWEQVEGWGDEWAAYIPLDRVGDVSMTASGSLSPVSNQDKATQARNQLVTSWIKLLDLLVLHILPRLDEWEAAADFVRLQSVENGGWVPDQRVEATLERLSQLRQQEIDSALAKVQRQRDLETRKAEQKREARAAATKLDKGKARARDDLSPGEAGRSTSTGSSPEKRKRAHHHRNGTAKSPSPTSASSSSPSPTSDVSPSLPSPAGFAGLRSSLSQYLSRSTSISAHETTTHRSTTSPLTVMAAYLRHHYATDPLRLLSMICFCLALATYLRRKFSLSNSKSRTLGFGAGVRSGLGLAMAKVGETLRMGTKVTTL
ncbi:uncharacterized protein JCM15063_000440 [Sporobolomyces koalae]|uniref:uncharacterized protein n=1 Tax=Sporobolomyces koalae TaxID=500713 RepID=UPI0031737992